MYFFENGKFTGYDEQRTWVGKDLRMPIDGWEIYVAKVYFKNLPDLSKFKEQNSETILMKFPTFANKNSISEFGTPVWIDHYTTVIPIE